MTKEVKKQFKRTKNLTLPVFQQKIDEARYIKFLEPMKIGKKVDKQKDAAILAPVVDLETGETFQFLVPSVVQGVLHDEYAAAKFAVIDDDMTETEASTGDLYVNKCFEIIKHPKKSGKQYHAFTLCEVEEG